MGGGFDGHLSGWSLRFGMILGAFLAGSIPTGYLMGRWFKGVDIRQHGSGNLGAANVFRVLGTGAGIVTLAVDVVKGTIPVACARVWEGASGWFSILTGLAAIAGHNWTPFLGFHGGKGVATSAGVCLALLPGPCGIALAIFVLTLMLTRYVSLGSVAAATALPLVTWGMDRPMPLVVFAAMAGGLIIWRHLPNLRRLRRGEEPRFQWRRAL